MAMNSFLTATKRRSKSGGHKARPLRNKIHAKTWVSPADANSDQKPCRGV